MAPASVGEVHFDIPQRDVLIDARFRSRSQDSRHTLAWLAAQSSVDPDRIGVIGASRGAELALLLGTLYPRVRVVVAYMPSNVVARGAAIRARGSTPRRSAADRLRRCRRPVVAIRWKRRAPRFRLNGSTGKGDGVWPSAD